MDPLYDLYLTGKLTTDAPPGQVAARLAQLFKSTPETMGRLLTGKPQLLKRGIDRATALKYREALTRAGVETAFKAHVQTASTSPNPTPAVASRAALTLAPAGTEVLTEQERQRPPAPEIDTAGLSLSPTDAPLNEQQTTQPAPPDVRHLSLSAEGSELLSPQERAQPPSSPPRAGDWTLAPSGTPLETLPVTPPAYIPKALDASLAPAGEALLSAAESERVVSSAPDTSHLRVLEPRA